MMEHISAGDYEIDDQSPKDYSVSSDEVDIELDRLAMEGHEFVLGSEIENEDEDKVLAYYRKHYYAVNQKVQSDKISIMTLAGLMLLCLYFLGQSVLASDSSLLSLAHPMNYHGLSCGYDETVRHLPFLYYPLDPNDGKSMNLMENRGICVRSCPTEKDVLNHAYVTFTQTSAAQASKHSAIVSVLHLIRSPVYATELHRKAYCLPKSPQLRTQALSFISTAQITGGTLRSVSSSLLSMIPLSFLFIIGAGVLSHLALHFLSRAPLLFTSLAIASSIAMLFLHAISLMFFTRDRAAGETYLAPGLISLCLGAAFLYYTVRNYGDIYYHPDALELMKIIAIESADAPSVIGTQVVLQLAGIGIIIFSIFTLTLTQCSTTIKPSFHDKQHALDIKLDPNGGIDIMPLERRHYFDSISFLKAGAITVTTIWLLEYLLALARYVVATTSKISYLQKRKGLSRMEYHNTAMEAFKAGIRKTTYPLTLLAVMRVINRFFSPLGTMMRNYILVTTAITELTLCHQPALSSFIRTHNRFAFHENLMHLVQVPTLVTHSLLVLVATSTYVLLSFIFLHFRHEDFGRDGPLSFAVSNPCLIAAIFAFLITYIAAITLVSLDAYMKAFIYLYIVDKDAHNGRAYRHGRIFNVIESYLEQPITRYRTSELARDEQQLAR